MMDNAFLGLHCHAIKNNSKTIQWIKLRNCDVIRDLNKEDTSVPFSKLEIFDKIFDTNL